MQLFGGILLAAALFTLVAVGTQFWRTTEAHAQAVVREFGANGSYASVAGGYLISVAVPAPGGITLMQQTLLTDGTNKMQRPLWMQNIVTSGTACTGNGLGVDASGDLMRCNGTAWQTH